MSKHDQIFRQLRQLPPEMSEEQVWEIIKILPSLPPPKTNWVTQLTSNQIIMNTINIIAFVTSLLVFNSSEVTTYPLTLDDRPQSSLLSIDPNTSQEDTAVPAIKSVTEGSSVEEITPLAPIPSEMLDESINLLMEDWDKEEYSVIEYNYLPLPAFTSPALGDHQQSFASPAAPNHDMFAFITDPNYSPGRLNTNHKTSNKQKRKDKQKDKNKVTSSKTPKEKSKDWKNTKKGKITRSYQLSCNESFPSGIDNLLPLKRRLRQAVKTDNLAGANQSLVRFSFDGPYILFNRQRIPTQLQNKYMSMIQEYDITPCDIRMIEITDEYIAAGDITADGFKGHMTGRVLLDNLNKVPISSLRPRNGRSQVETRPIEDFHSLVVDGLAVVYLSQGKSNTASVDVSGMPIRDLITTVKDGVLTISTRGKHNGESIKVEISAETLQSIEVNGAAELYSKAPVLGDDLFIRVADVGSAWLEVDTKKVRIEMFGGDLFISGKTDRQSLVTGGKAAHRGTFDNSRLTITEQ